MQGATLGNFTLIKLLGKGGMGQVWQAVHQDQGHHVAIKFLTSEAARQDTFQRSFEHEVLSMARMHHRNIAMIIDYGLLQHDMEDLHAGSPYLIMEYIEGKPLKDAKQALTWEQLSHQIRDLLEALAHAHAKGIIHRDLKPQNVLVTPRGASKLVDFGIALNHEHTQRTPLKDIKDANAENKITGTPRYMSPEQIEGRWREQGPWTDLYAMGCLFWEMATGKPLFPGNLMLVLASQLAQQPPPLQPRFAVPKGFERWLNTLLRKDPRERFQRAADALAAFEEVAKTFEPDQQVRQTIDMDTSDVEADPDEATMLVDIDEGLTSTMERIRRMRAIQDLERKRIDAPPAAPLLRDWRDADDAPHRLDVLGAGLGLWGVRSFPMIGRERERDLLWQALLLTARKRSPQFCLLRGEPGCGKSRLADWMCRRAHESGAAHIFKASFSPHGSSQDGLSPMLVKFFDTYGLDRSERAEQITTRLGSTSRVDLAALVELTELELPEASTQMLDFKKEFHNLRERHYALIDLLVHLAEERPVILWIDDIQWGMEGTLFLRDLFQRDLLYDLPLMILATERVDGSSNEAIKYLNSIKQLPSSRILDLTHLTDKEHADLVHEMLGLEPNLAKQVVTRTQGNPLFAVQIVGDWVERGMLVTGSQGFRLKQGVTTSLPTDLHDLWDSRLAHVFGKFPHHSADTLEQALQLAAALGQDISPLEWRSLTARLELSVPPQLFDTLATSQLIKQDTTTQNAWSFAHSLLHEHLVAKSKQQHRWTSYHLTIAQWLTEQGEHFDNPQHERISRHFMLAERWEEATAPLSEAINKRLIFHDLDTSRLLIDAYKLCVEHMHVEETHPLHVKGIAYEAYLARNLGERARAQTLIEDAYNKIQVSGDKNVLALILKTLSRLYEDTGDMERSARLASDTAAIQKELGNTYDYAMAVVGQAQALGLMGNYEEANTLVMQAIDILKKLDRPTGLTIAYYIVALVDLINGKKQTTAENLYRVLDMSRQQGNRMQEGNAENLLGHLEMERKNYSKAHHHFERARDLFRPCGEMLTIIAEVNILTIDVIEAQDPSQLIVRLKDLKYQATKRDQSRLFGVLYMNEIYLHTKLQQWAEWDDAYTHLITWFQSTQSSPIEATILKRTGEILLDLGHLERARKILLVALASWQNLHDDTEIASVKDLIDRCRLFL